MFLAFASCLLSLVHQSGELETLLEDNGVIPKVEESTATAEKMS
jgi:hypothetical protein